MSERLSAGDTAPDFTLTSDTGDAVTLSALRGRRVIVYFYPAAMTPGCTTQAVDFTANAADIDSAGFDVVGISPTPRPSWPRSARRRRSTSPCWPTRTARS